MRIRILLILCTAFLIPHPLFAQTTSKRIRVSFEIEPVTVMRVSSNSGVSAVRLGPISPRASVPPQSLEVSVVSNTHQRYEVYHHLHEDIPNAAGTQFPSARLHFMVTPGTEGGDSRIPHFVEIPQGDAPIFTSKQEGGSDLFHIYYLIENKEIISAGTYYGNITIDVHPE